MKYALWAVQGLLAMILLALAASYLAAGRAGAQSDGRHARTGWGAD